jgi:hypothetical protein
VNPLVQRAAPSSPASAAPPKWSAWSFIRVSDVTMPPSTTSSSRWARSSGASTSAGAPVFTTVTSRWAS